MRGPMNGPHGKLIAPTNKKFHIEFCTVAHWKNGEIIEEKLLYDLVGLLNRSALCERFCSASHFTIRGCLLSVPYRKALPKMGRAFQFVDHRDGVILN